MKPKHAGRPYFARPRHAAAAASQASRFFLSGAGRQLLVVVRWLSLLSFLLVLLVYCYCFHYFFSFYKLFLGIQGFKSSGWRLRQDGEMRASWDYKLGELLFRTSRTPHKVCQFEFMSCELQSKLPVSPLIRLIVVPYRIPYTTPFKEFKP